VNRLNFYLLRSSLVAALGGLLFGFDTALLAGTTRALTALYSLSPGMLGLTVSMALWGTVMRSLLAGPPPIDMAARSGAIPFFFFAAMMTVQFVVVLKMYPETAGVSLESMERHMADASPRTHPKT
jgi:hypothetical protein